MEFERFADDAVVHCATERQALQVRAALSERMEEVGLRLHPGKTKVVYCKDGNGGTIMSARRSHSWIYLPCQEGPDGRREEHVRSVPPGDQRGRPERQRSYSSRVADQPAHHFEPTALKYSRLCPILGDSIFRW